MKILKLKSDFAILDVTKGHAALEKHFEARPFFGPCPNHLRIPVTITGYIDCVHGASDGKSQEFQIIIENINNGQPK